MRNLQTGLMVLLAAMLIHLTAGAASGAVTDPANTATVSVTSAYAKGGEEVSVFVTLKNNPGFAGFAFHIQYDENVAQLVKVQRGELLSSNSGSLTTNLSGGNAVWYDTVDTVGDGTLLELRFRVQESESFATTSVSVYPKDHIEKNFNNLAKEAIPCVWQAGKIACRVGELAVDDSLMLEENGTLHYEIEDIPWGEETKTVSLIAACYQGGRLVDLQMVQKDLTLGDQSILIKNKEEYDEVRLFFLDDKAYEPLVQVLKIMKGAS